MPKGISLRTELLEKIIFALLPLLFSCMVYFASSLRNVRLEVAEISNRVAVVVTADQKQVPNTAALDEIEKLRQDLGNQIQRNRDMILEDRQYITSIENSFQPRNNINHLDKKEQ